MITDSQIETVGWAILQALHADLPEAARPQCWSDLNGLQERRIKGAAALALGAAKSVMVEDFSNLSINRRYIRANQITATLLNVIREHGADLLYSHWRALSGALFALFHDQGFEIITDHDRAALGLPPRNHDGWTAAELQILEARRLEAMLKPIMLECPSTAGPLPTVKTPSEPSGLASNVE